ncbi:UNVERIFIED_CONTAM: hypothetical protein HHA_243670 [Hammondia hammondi]|eukprot:XP_008884326.1 hypothetical protein HHA_243670 [Hammondia hammondi]
MNGDLVAWTYSSRALPRLIEQLRRAPALGPSKVLEALLTIKGIISDQEEKCKALQYDAVAAVTPLLDFNTEHPFECRFLGASRQQRAKFDTIERVQEIARTSATTDMSSSLRECQQIDLSQTAVDRGKRREDSEKACDKRKLHFRNGAIDEANSDFYNDIRFGGSCTVEGHGSPQTRIGNASCSGSCPYKSSSCDFLIQAAAAEVIGCAGLLPAGRRAAKESGATERLGERLLVTQSAAVRLAVAEALRKMTSHIEGTQLLRQAGAVSRLCTFVQIRLNKIPENHVAILKFTLVAGLCHFFSILHIGSCAYTEVTDKSLLYLKIRVLRLLCVLCATAEGRATASTAGVLPELLIDRSLDDRQGLLLFKLVQSCSECLLLKRKIVQQFRQFPDLLHRLYGSSAVREITSILRAALTAEQDEQREREETSEAAHTQLLLALADEQRKLEESIRGFTETGMKADENCVTSGLALGSGGVFDTGNTPPAPWFTICDNKERRSSGRRRGTEEETPLMSEEDLNLSLVETNQKGEGLLEKASKLATEEADSASGSSTAQPQEAYQLEDERFVDLLQQLHEKKAFNYGGEQAGNCCCRTCLSSDARRAELLPVRRNR